jgi:hypothetical protein
MTADFDGKHLTANNASHCSYYSLINRRVNAGFTGQWIRFSSSKLQDVGFIIRLLSQKSNFTHKGWQK